MITIENLPIYRKDTPATIRERIASIRNSVPALIYIPPDRLPAKFQDMKTLTISFVDYLSDINNELNSQRPSFEHFYNEPNVKEGIYNKEFIALLWTFLEAKTMTDANPDNLPFAIMTASKTYKDVQAIMEVHPIHKLSDVNFPVQMESFFNKLESNIKANQTHVELEEGHDELESVPYNEFKLESIKYEFTLSVENIPIEDIFNALVLTDFFPLAKLGSYYKIHKKYVPTSKDEIAETSNSVIQLFFRVGDLMKPVYLSLDPSHRLSMTIQIKLSKTDTKKLIASILDTLKNLKAEVTVEKSFRYNGVYIVPNQDFDRVYLSHMIMNDNVFSRYLYIDESRSAGAKIDYLHIHFMVPSSNDVFTAVLTKHDNNVRVKISDALSIEHVITFQEVMSRLLNVYNKNKDKVKAIYERLRPSDYKASSKTQVVGGEKSGKYKLPKDVFPGTFSRTCQPKFRHVSMLSDEDNLAELNPKSYMVFPKSMEEGDQYTYVCKNPLSPYIGLVDFDKKNKYNFLPCCYETDRENSDTFNRYFKGQKVEGARPYHTITTSKILDNLRTGTLDKFPNISKLLQVLSPPPNIPVTRTGVHRSTKSLLECVLVGLGLETFQNEPLNNLCAILDRIVRDDNLLQSVRQENPGLSIDQIRTMLKDRKAYLDPKLFYRLLEEYYKCKIFFFDGDSIGVPNHAKNYLTLESTFERPTLMILQHFGSESDIVKGQEMIPQCELVGMKMQHTDPVAQGLKKMFLNVTRSYHKGKLVLPRSLEFKASSQIINEYGKTVALVHKNANILLYLTNPIPPLVLPITEDYDIFSVPKTLDLLKKLPFITTTNKFEKVRLTTVVEAKSESSTYFVPVELEMPYAIKTIGVTKDHETIPHPRGASALNYFSINKKLSWHIVQQLFYLFSKYIDTKNITLDNDPGKKEVIINKFLSDHTALRLDAYSNIGYGMLNNTIVLPYLFSEPSPVVQHDRILIMKDMLPKLKYRLLLALNNNIESVLAYKDRKFLVTRLKSITDMDIFPNQIILDGVDSVNEYIKTLDVFHTPMDAVDPDKDEPYFFKFVGENVFLSKNVGTAKEVATFIGGGATICAYKSPDDINILSEATTGDFVLGYRYDDHLRYTLLLHGV